MPPRMRGAWAAPLEHGEVKLGEYDAQDRIQTYGDLAYAFTDDGALRSKVDTVSGDTTTYTTDALGNLTRVDLPDGRVIEYVVDPDQRRVGKKIDGVMVKQWLYRDDLRITAELDGTGNVVSRFVWADGAGADESAVRQVLTRLGLSLPELLQQALRELRQPLTAPAYVLRGGMLYRRYAETLAEQAVGLAAIRSYVAAFQRVRPEDERKYPVVREAIEFTIRQEGGTHYEALLGGGDVEGARVVADELVRFRPTCRTFAVLIERALRAGASGEAVRLREQGARLLPASDRACLASPEERPG